MVKQIFVWVAALSFLSSPAMIAIAGMVDSNADLGVSFFQVDTNDPAVKRIYIETKNSSFDEVGVHFSLDGKVWKDQELPCFPEASICRGFVTELRVGEPIQISVYGKDLVADAISWDNHFQKNHVIVAKNLPARQPVVLQGGEPGPAPSIPRDDQLEKAIDRVKQELDYPMRASPYEVKKVRKFLKENKVYVSLTTSPERLPRIHHVLETLDLRKVEKVFLAIPRAYSKNRTGYSQEEKDKLIRLYPKVEILEIPEDLGPITKLLPAVREVKKRQQPGALIITVDDDQAYSKAMIPELILVSALRPRTAISGSGADLSTWNISDFGFPQTTENHWRKKSMRTQYQYTDVIEGFGGVAYRAEWVDDELMEHMAKLDRNCYFSDDLVISFVLALGGIHRMKLNNLYYSVNHRKDFPYGLLADALHHGSGLGITSESNVNAAKYQRCYQYLIEATNEFTEKSVIPRARERVLGVLH